MGRKIETIENIGGFTSKIKVIFNDKEWADFYSFGKDVFTVVSDGVLKSTLSNFKKDVLKSGWNVEQLREWYL